MMGFCFNDFSQLCVVRIFLFILHDFKPNACLPSIQTGMKPSFHVLGVSENTKGEK